MTDPRIYTEADWRVLDSLKVRNLTALKGITEQVNARIVRELVDGVNAGESVPKLTKRLQDSVNFGKQRATVMARTEVINACADGARVRYEQYGVKESRYIAASDSRTCQQCADLDNKVFPMGDNAHMPPLHPNCRCCIAAVIPKRGTRSKPTSSQKPNNSLVSFTERSDLTRAEKQALSYYQDIGNPQHNWDVAIPVSNEHRDCYVINTSLRSAEFRASLSEHDRRLVDKLTDQMDNAINKSVIHNQTDIIRGLADPTWLEKIDAGFVDDAYGSFTLDVAIASTFAGVNKQGEKVFLYRELKKGDKAVSLGDKEKEMLVPRARTYVVDDIVRFDEDEFISGHKAIVYYIREI